jgi:hypothetical protein
MPNWKLIGATSAAVTVVIIIAAYSLTPGQTVQVPTASALYGSLHVKMSRERVAQSQCIDHGQTCVLNGTPCCLDTDACAGTFPNTYCQPKPTP